MDVFVPVLQALSSEFRYAFTAGEGIEFCSPVAWIKWDQSQPGELCSH